VIVDLPVLDAPLNLSSDDYTLPTMRQSLAASTDFYSVAHRALGGPTRRSWRVWLIAGFDLLSNYIPLGSSWVHEEWHRAVMSRRGVSSFDDVYNFPLFSNLIAVSHETDEDLTRLKRDHPAEFVRLSAAGMEAQTEQNLELARRHFFDNQRTYDGILLAMNDLSVFGYLSSCASSRADATTDSQNNADGSDVSKRDFTGLDCTAWVYDLFRPNEPYAARGIHPSGVGFNRYIHYSDLTDEERSFLKRQVWLTVLNAADPFIFGFDHFVGDWDGIPYQWNARLAHYLTSFGYTVDADFFLNIENQKFLIQLQNGFNADTYFPGFSMEWREQRLPWDRWFMSHQLTLWNQPRGQYVKARDGDMMVAAGTRLMYQIGTDIFPYVGVEAKTPGWLAGNVFLDRGFSVWTGLRVGIF